MLGIRIGLGNVLSLDVDAAEASLQRSVDHVGDAQARFRVDGHAPFLFIDGAYRRLADVAIAGQFVREAAHVAAALHIVLSTQRIYADAAAADIAGGHGKICDRHDSRAALAVLRHAEAIVDRTVPAGGVEAGGAAYQGSGHAGHRFRRFGTVPRVADEVRPFIIDVY